MSVGSANLRQLAEPLDTFLGLQIPQRSLVQQPLCQTMKNDVRLEQRVDEPEFIPPRCAGSLHDRAVLLLREIIEMARERGDIVRLFNDPRNRTLNVAGREVAE